MKRVKSNAWLVFAFLGFLFIGWGLHQIFVIPTYDDHWAWLATGDSEIWDYIKFRFQNHGLWTAANGIFILLVALTGLRNREYWAWWTLAYVPVHIILLTTLFYWLFFITIPLVFLATWSLWASRSQLRSGISNHRGFGWVILFAIGLLLLYFAYDNFFIIPALDVHDPDRGWDWLTTDPEIIDYIKFYFRVYGIRVFGFGMLTILTTVTGLRNGYRSAWIVLWTVPVLVIIHFFIWSWTAPILAGVLIIAGLGLWLSYPKIKPAPEAREGLIL